MEWQRGWLSAQVNALNPLPKPNHLTNQRYGRWHHISMWLKLRQAHPHAQAVQMFQSIAASGPLNQRYEVSHLCHYRGCANPDHLENESLLMNGARNTCQGLFAWKITMNNTETVLHPCTHRRGPQAGSGAVKECVLPVATVTDPGYYYKAQGFLGAGEV